MQKELFVITKTLNYLEKGEVGSDLCNSQGWLSLWKSF